MSKAFDSIEHNLFLNKLSAYRILNKEHADDSKTISQTGFRQSLSMEPTLSGFGRLSTLRNFEKEGQEEATDV